MCVCVCVAHCLHVTARSSGVFTGSVHIWKHFKVQCHSHGLTSIVAAKMPVTHIVLLISSCLVFTTLLAFMCAACVGTTFMLGAVSTSSMRLCVWGWFL